MAAGKNSNMILIIGAIAALFVVALAMMAVLNSNSEAGGQSAATSDQIARSEQIERQLLAELLQLRDIKLDDSLFSSPEFTSLEDFSRPIQGQPVGRENPFAPIDENDPELREALRKSSF